MSHKVYVLLKVGYEHSLLMSPTEPTIELDDESADALSHSTGTLVCAISPSGPNAYFNSRQVRGLVAELRAAAGPASRAVQRNLNDVADFIAKHTHEGTLDRYVSFVA